ncbi:molybdopterin-binding protein [Actinoplanes ianthinogenes]|uniref:Molybdopterin-binding protein n=1 Tax=Actinoplanes ianthinogenes TaxID=122358 RepID=A0ABN6CSV8_9ACTN|nr:molybdopterin-dependent oxidoreductase [Actinoplanes ianthinogenes]BCJ48353.1 molybdopterin-binding protein [Actinoplanes ianthinogenes]GGR46953.1 molybdopterin-binding protein [Actinoplanes ianthinogenes]
MVRHTATRLGRTLTWLAPLGRLRRDSATRLRTALTWLNQPLPAPPERLRRGPLRAGAFQAGPRSTRLTAQLGVALGVAFGVCFATGLLSHLIQHPPGWFWWPSRPAGLYRFTQGLHVATGLAAVPLLGAKLWSVYPRLFTWPPLSDVAHAAERASVAVLVGAALFQVVSGVFNIARWYPPMPFFFTAAHYWMAWVAAGALLVHIGAQLPRIRNPQDGPGRRRFLAAVAAAAGVVTLSTVGQTVRPLTPVSLLAPRRPGTGPQGVPVNQTATGAGVRDAALDPGYHLTVAGFGRVVELSLADLAALPQHTTVLAIACVEGWSSTGTWTGVRLRDLVALLGADPGGCTARVESLQAGGRYRASEVATPHLTDERTLIALRLGGEPLALDHGYPARLIAPNRPGVLQTKWLSRITVRSAA